MSPKAYEQVAWAFAHGGYVSVYDADTFLHLERGTCRKAALAGKLLYSARSRGRLTRYFVKAQDAERLFGVAAHAAHDAGLAVAGAQS